MGQENVDGSKDEQQEWGDEQSTTLLLSNTANEVDPEMFVATQSPDDDDAGLNDTRSLLLRCTAEASFEQDVDAATQVDDGNELTSLLKDDPV